MERKQSQAERPEREILIQAGMPKYPIIQKF